MTRTIILAAIVAAFALPAQAGRCTTHDKWTGPDKLLHAQGGGAIGAVGAIEGDYWRGVRWAAYVGAAKEAVDAAGMGTCSLQDFLATVAGGMVGAGLGYSVSLIRDKDPAGGARVTLLLQREF